MAPGPALRVRRSAADLVVGLGLCGVAGWFWVRAAAIEDYADTSIGSDTFPRALAVLLGATALALVVGAIWRVATGPARHLIVVRRPFGVALGMALLVAFPAILEPLGYYPAMALWLAVFLWLGGCRRWPSILAIVAGFLVFTYVVFGLVFKTPLP